MSPTPISTRQFAFAVAALLAVAVAACSSGSGKTTGTTTGAAAASPSSAAVALEDTFERVVDRVRPSVVEISTGSSLGSGIAFDTKGDIVTNNHVVADATHFQVALPVT